MGSTDTGTTVLNRLIGDGELTQVMTNHLRLNLNLVKGLSIVNTNIGSNHLRDNDHVTQMSLHHRGLLLKGSLTNGLTETLDQGSGSTTKSTAEATTSTSVQQLNKLLSGQLDQIIQVDSTEGELAELALLLELSGVNISLKLSIRYLGEDGWMAWGREGRNKGTYHFGWL